MMPDGPDPIADLLRLTGPRPVVPAARAARVRVAVHAAWRAAGARERRRRLSLRLAALAAALVAAVAIPAWRGWRPFGGAGADVAARVEVGSSSWRPGQTLPPGTLLETRGADRLAVRLPSGHSVRLDVGSRARLVSAGVLEILGGGVYVDSGRPGTRPDDTGALRLRTPAGTIEERGTQFEVRLIDAAVRVRVREGRVALQRREGPLDVAAGREVVALGDGSVRESPLPDSGDAWGWVGEVAPLPAIEGRTLGEFLDWYARERGRAIRFEDPGLEASSRAIRLSGSIDGMTPDQALDSVLTISRLGRRVEANVVSIEPASGPQ